MLILLLSLCLAPSSPWQEPYPNEFAPWLLTSQGELHLAEYLQHELLLSAARDAQLLPTALEVQAALSIQIALRVENAHGGDRAAWAEELLRLGRNEATWRIEHRASALNQLVIDRLARARRVISEAEVRAAWEARHGPGGRAATVRWIQIAIIARAPVPGATRDEERALREATREAARLRGAEVASAWRAGADFAALQTRAGSGAEPPQAFRLDEFRWPALVQTSIAAMELGEISAPLAARGGWSLLQLTSTEHTPFESVRGSLHEVLVSRPTNSAETNALFAELTALHKPEAVLPDAAYEGEPLTSDLAIGQMGERSLSLRAFTQWLIDTRGRTHFGPFAQAQFIAQSSKQFGYTPTPEEIAERRESDLSDRIELFYAGDRDRWLAELAQDGRSRSGWRRDADRRAHHDLCAEALLIAGRTVSEEAVHAAWEERYGPQGYARTVSWLLLTPPAPPADLESDAIQGWLHTELETLATEAAALRERIVEGGEDFAALARRHSKDPATSQTGGAIPGVFDPRTQPAVIAGAVEALKAGAVSHPVRLPFGSALFQVQRIVHTPIDEVQEELRSALHLRRPSAAELAGFVNSFCLEAIR